VGLGIVYGNLSLQTVIAQAKSIEFPLIQKKVRRKKKKMHENPGVDICCCLLVFFLDERARKRANDGFSLLFIQSFGVV